MVMEDRNGTPKGKHILVVDDDIELALMCEAFLQFRGFSVSTAANGVQALKLVLNSDVDAVLCDLNMPELGGDLLYLEIGRVRPQLLKRFIFLTGNADNPLYSAFLKRVKVPVLSKPVSFDGLLEKLQALLGPQPQARPVT
jgi:two-component system, NtrC family, response regulator GlrR